MAGTFPQQQPGLLYLTEGGQETEIMYRHGFELPEFALFPLLDQPEAVDLLQTMYGRVLDTAAARGFGVILGGLDYRASPDWADLLGYSADELLAMQLRCIAFLREVGEPHRERLPALYYAGIVGPRGDAYTLSAVTTPDESQDYHAAQMSNLAAAGVDLVEAMTFNSVPEAVGVCRAAARAGLPVSISFTLDSNHRLHSGPSLKAAIESVDEQTGEDRPAFYGINCSHPAEFLPALEPGEWFERVRSLRPNAAMMDKIALCSLGHLESGDPDDLGRRMGALAEAYPHLDIWGGCCGTWDTHLGAHRPRRSTRRARP